MSNSLGKIKQSFKDTGKEIGNFTRKSYGSITALTGTSELYNFLNVVFDKCYRFMTQRFVWEMERLYLDSLAKPSFVPPTDGSVKFSFEENVYYLMRCINQSKIDAGNIFSNTLLFNVVSTFVPGGAALTPHLVVSLRLLALYIGNLFDLLTPIEKESLDTLFKPKYVQEYRKKYTIKDIAENFNKYKQEAGGKLSIEVPLRTGSVIGELIKITPKGKGLYGEGTYQLKFFIVEIGSISFVADFADQDDQVAKGEKEKPPCFKYKNFKGSKAVYFAKPITKIIDNVSVVKVGSDGWKLQVENVQTGGKKPTGVELTRKERKDIINRNRLYGPPPSGPPPPKGPPPEIPIGQPRPPPSGPPPLTPEDRAAMDKAERDRKKDIIHKKLLGLSPSGPKPPKYPPPPNYPPTPSDNEPLSDDKPPSDEVPVPYEVPSYLQKGQQENKEVADTKDIEDIDLEIVDKPEPVQQPPVQQTPDQTEWDSTTKTPIFIGFNGVYMGVLENITFPEKETGTKTKKGGNLRKKKTKRKNDRKIVGGDLKDYTIFHIRDDNKEIRKIRYETSKLGTKSQFINDPKIENWIELYQVSGGSSDSTVVGKETTGNPSGEEVQGTSVGENPQGTPVLKGDQETTGVEGNQYIPDQETQDTSAQEVTPVEENLDTSVGEPPGTPDQNIPSQKGKPVDNTLDISKQDGTLDRLKEDGTMSVAEKTIDSSEPNYGAVTEKPTAKTSLLDAICTIS
jgi:hypothetical protein